eukprot:2462638-Rhodomonas_salina.2
MHVIDRHRTSSLPMTCAASSFLCGHDAATMLVPLPPRSALHPCINHLTSGAAQLRLSSLDALVPARAGISSFAAGIGRLGDFVDAMEKSQQKAKSLRTEDLVRTPPRYSLSFFARFVLH